MTNMEQRIIKHFSGIDALRNKAKQEVDYVESNKNKYNPTFVKEFKQEKRQELIADRQERARKATEEIAKIKKELATKQYKNIYQELYDDPNMPVIKAEHKLLAEINQNLKMQILRAELATAETVEDFKYLIQQYGEYENFDRVIKSAVNKRATKSNDTELLTLRYELEAEPQEVKELNKLQQWVSFFGSIDQHPGGLDNGDFKNVQYESLI